ncbi:methyltransferase [Streptomyces sp. NPDC056161]|uniref:methyltransferase n=1 Tax=Streptomyces sp. NPDC056161 TaxID=3345732 RepID=UPI0035DC10E8
MSAPTPPPGVVMTQLLGGFQVSQALYVVAKLDVCTLLDDGPRTVADLAEYSGVSADPLGRLISTLTMVGVFRSEGDLVATTPLGALLSRDHPASLAGAAELWMETHYGPFGGLLETVRSGVPGATQYFGKPFFEWLSEDQERSALMTRAMANVTGALREGVFDGYDLPPGRVVADIGGADGSVLVQLIAERPERTGVILDLAPVEPAATAHLAERGLDDRITFTAGDFFESVPTADVYVLSFVLHDWDDDSAVRILESIRKAANPGARLLVLEGVIPPGDTPHMMKMVDLTMLGMLPGRERTEPEFRTLLERAGFAFDGVVPTSTVFSIVEASVD